ncbi:alanyl-tRNA editing protein [Terriglobus aquaticus]|uniref:Alanine--tRNA ligase n=1 Tax=Terriglobus aquaticus TaxID=940139 RepID=A0ABW9KG71_9BACT|nr:alanyl-tRNA editing protein [Terriglobus aquaticus]
MATTERLYYADSSLLEFSATVTEIRELARVEGKPVFQVALDRTAFYPTGGGQPHDTGVLVATARSGAVLEAPVTDVVEDEAGEVWHTTAKPLQPGTEVTGRVDAERRRDHMQQHSGQHLLSAIAARAWGAATVGFHLGELDTTVDLAVPLLTAEQVAMLQQQANDAVMQAMSVTQRWIGREEAEGLLAAGVLRKLPPRAGDLRVVTIAGLDENACGGTHVANTAAIGPVLLRKVEKIRGNSRVRFVCGGRALRAATADWAQLSEIASSLSTAPASLRERVAKMQAEIAEARRQAKDQAR